MNYELFLPLLNSQTPKIHMSKLLYSQTPKLLKIILLNS